jgi:hypothetical protein
MSWMNKKTGRPQEEEGHERINVSLNKFSRQWLKKVRKRKRSDFLDRAIGKVATFGITDPGEFVFVLHARDLRPKYRK